uniref:Uncharacterized protein n=1 Tax=Glossina brevipalpis TaxID=37001 RepID=A0A1A9WS85_9MUSC
MDNILATVGGEGFNLGESIDIDTAEEEMADEAIEAAIVVMTVVFVLAVFFTVAVIIGTVAVVTLTIGSSRKLLKFVDFSVASIVNSIKPAPQLSSAEPVDGGGSICVLTLLKNFSGCSAVFGSSFSLKTDSELMLQLTTLKNK